MEAGGRTQPVWSRVAPVPTQLPASFPTGWLCSRWPHGALRGIKSHLLRSAWVTLGNAGCGHTAGLGVLAALGHLHQLSGRLAVPGRPACSVQVYVSLIKIKMSDG